jgi:hypothetical protein
MTCSSETASAFLTAFPACSLERYAPLKDAMLAAGMDAAASKRLDRARMLHTVISSRLPDLVKIEDLRKMCIEWVHGLLEATFPLETKLIDAECSDVATLGALTHVLDGAHRVAMQLAWVLSEEAKAAAASEASSSDGGGGAPAASDDASVAAVEKTDAAPPPTQAEASKLLENAVKAGATFEDVVPNSSPEAQALGYEVWEALCWRRGALRYYITATAVNQRLSASAPTPPSEPSSDASAAAVAVVDATNARTGAATCAEVATMEESYAALTLLLSARNHVDVQKEVASQAPAAASDEKLAAALRYGAYSTTHLLALAFSVELCYWRWTAALTNQSTDADDAAAEPAVVDIGEAAAAPAAAAKVDEPVAESASTEAADATEWHRRACVGAHRYMHTVLVLMEGCAWDTTRTAELLRLLRTGREDALAVALRDEEGVAEREMAALQLSAAPAPDGAAAGAAAGATNKSSSKERKAKGSKANK